MNELKITNSNIIFNNLEINWKQLSVDEFLKGINSGYRIIKLEKEIVLYIVDEQGIRFWVSNNKIEQAELFIKKQEGNPKDYKIPENVYNGTITINDEEFKAPIIINNFKNNQAIKIVKDPDSIQYGLNIYFVYLSERKYTLWVDKKDKEVTSFYF